MSLKIKNLTFYFKNTATPLFHNLNLEIESGSRVAIVGSSGSGKSTLLSLVAGFARPQHGEILFGDKLITGPKRSRAMIFQNYALFPWLTVLENLKLVFDGSNLNSEKQNQKIAEILSLMGLRDIESYFPAQLSGGMQQRVSMARALLSEPELLLLDEPFAALDVFHRHRLLEELILLIKKQKFTSLFVTHNLEDALFFGERVIVLSRGRIIADKSLKDFRRDTATTKVNDLKNDPQFLALEKEIYEIILEQSLNSFSSAHVPGPTHRLL